ncbi:MAG: hypothetical protein DLM64_13225 [Solirubrobacterales bacterium]|nr:MAG: hypothetical protein DLM64_13225 [Solirubrobacterales bacterium]
MSTLVLTILSVAEAVALVVVLALALTEIRRRLETISEGLKTLAGALTTVESEHLRPLGGALQEINEDATALLPLLQQIGAKAAIVAREVGPK